MAAAMLYNVIPTPFTKHYNRWFLKDDWKSVPTSMKLDDLEDSYSQLFQRLEQKRIAKAELGNPLESAPAGWHFKRISTIPLKKNTIQIARWPVFAAENGFCFEVDLN
jgi:hypothetical protein